MEPGINSSPALTMVDIISKLCNCKFVSDIQFIVEEKVIYAHSFILMVRSAVFQKQLEVTLGVQKLIPILNIRYDSVNQFIRFIYTDKCVINNENVIDLLTLAQRYKISKLENLIMNSMNGSKINLLLFEHCLLANDQFQLPRIVESVFLNLEEYLECDTFLTVHPIVIEEILKSNRTNCSEMQLFNGLTRWLAKAEGDKKCVISQQQVNYLFGLIRQSTFIGEQILLREKFDFDYVWINYFRHTTFKTKFTVTREVLFTGLRYGNENKKAPTTIKLVQRDPRVRGVTKKCSMQFRASPLYNSNVINLGESIRLTPNMEYTVEIGYCAKPQQMSIFCRKESKSVFINAPNILKVKEVSRNLFTLFVTLPLE